MLAACGPCGRVETQWEAALGAERAQVGTANLPDTGLADHLQLRLSAAAFDALVAAVPAADVFDPVAGQATLRGQTARDAVIVGVELTPRLGGVTPVAGDTPTLVLALDATATVAYDAIDRRGTSLSMVAHATVTAALRFVDDGAGVALLLDPAAAELHAVQIDPFEPPSGFEDTDPAVARGLIEELLAEAVGATQDPIALLHWSPPVVGTSTLRLVPSRLEVDASTGAVTLGVVTTLRPVGAGPESTTAPPADPTNAEFSMAVHADLWRAALVQAATTGRIPRRFDANGVAAIDGPIAIGFTAATVDDDQLRLRVRSFCLGLERCRVEVWRPQGELTVASGRVEVVLAAFAAEEADRQERGAFMPALRDVAASTLASLLAPPTLEAFDRQPLAAAVDAVVVSGTDVVVAGTIGGAATR